jgi:PilZ domain-containing protein
MGGPANQPYTSVAAIPDTPERRRAPRKIYESKGWISSEAGSGGNEASRTVDVIDLSLYGAGFISDDQFQPDAIHWMVLGGGGLRASSRIRIVSCRPRDDGRYDCGVEFF